MSKKNDTVDEEDWVKAYISAYNLVKQRMSFPSSWQAHMLGQLTYGFATPGEILGCCPKQMDLQSTHRSIAAAYRYLPHSSEHSELYSRVPDIYKENLPSKRPRRLTITSEEPINTDLKNTIEPITESNFEIQSNDNYDKPTRGWCERFGKGNEKTISGTIITHRRG